MNSSPTTIQPGEVDDLTLGDADPTIASLEDIYLDGTLVLIGCGAQKRDPSDPQDLHAAAVGPDEDFRTGTGPAWEAQDLYTHWYFQAKRKFAELVSTWSSDAGDEDADPPGWAILSAEHGVLFPWSKLKPYDTIIEDLGGDETTPDHRVSNSYARRRPDGREIVTERDRWAANVAYGLARWQAMFRDEAAASPRSSNRANTLLVLAGQSYLDPLRDRGVFEYGISKMVRGADGPTLPVGNTRFLFEELDAGGLGEQGAWLSDAVDRLEGQVTSVESEQAALTEVDHV